MLQQFKLTRHHNGQYSNAVLLDTMVDALSLGLLRFSHMEALQKDPGYQKITYWRWLMKALCVIS